MFTEYNYNISSNADTRRRYRASTPYYREFRRTNAPTSYRERSVASTVTWYRPSSPTYEPVEKVQEPVVFETPLPPPKESTADELLGDACLLWAEVIMAKFPD